MIRGGSWCGRWGRLSRRVRERSPCAPCHRDSAKTKGPPRSGTMGGRCRSTAKEMRSDEQVFGA